MKHWIQYEITTYSKTEEPKSVTSMPQLLKVAIHTSLQSVFRLELLCVAHRAKNAI